MRQLRSTQSCQKFFDNKIIDFLTNKSEDQEFTSSVPADRQLNDVRNSTNLKPKKENNE